MLVFILDLRGENPKRLGGGCHALKVNGAPIGGEMKAGVALEISVQ